MKTYEEHPLSQLLPMMKEAELNELAQDIKLNGCLAPVTLYEGKILDGRNRLKACQLVGVEPKFRQLNGEDPIAFIVSVNIKRRHLTPSQRAMIAARIEGMKQGRPSRGSNSEKSRAEAAKELEVSPRSVATAKQVLEEASPEDIEAVEQGEKTVTEVARKTKAKSDRPKENIDRTGYPIPESIIWEWQRAQETARTLLAKISDVRSELKNALSESDLIFAEVTNTTIADLDNAYTSLKCVSPYAVCTSCQGHNRKKCTLCKGRGFISEFAWRSFVPSEIKKLRVHK